MVTSDRNPFSSPAERNRNSFLVYATGLILLMIFVRPILGRWAVFVLPPLIGIVGFAILISVTRARIANGSARAGREPVWGWWPPTNSASPFGQRQAFAIKAGRFYALAFEHDAIVVSKPIASKRQAKRWVTKYIAGETNKLGHIIDIDDIEEVLVTPGQSVKISGNGTSYHFDGWFNRFDGQHHEELKAVVQRLDLSVVDSGHHARFVRADHVSLKPSARGATDLLTKPSKTSEPISLGGGPNMFDFGGPRA